MGDSDQQLRGMLPIPDRQRFASGIHLRQGTRIDAGQGLGGADRTVQHPDGVLQRRCGKSAGTVGVLRRRHRLSDADGIERHRDMGLSTDQTHPQGERLG